ncbi:MAG: hypothetical protein AAGB04_16540 [Pseudomonadota bacterium]
MVRWPSHQRAISFIEAAIDQIATGAPHARQGASSFFPAHSPRNHSTHCLIAAVGVVTISLGFGLSLADSNTPREAVDLTYEWRLEKVENVSLVVRPVLISARATPNDWSTHNQAGSPLT